VIWIALLSSFEPHFDYTSALGDNSKSKPFIYKRRAGFALISVGPRTGILME
jgi:hypothetical protein